MNKREKEVIQAQLDAEKAVIADIEKQYNRALKDIGEKVKQFDYDISRLDDALNADGIDDATRARLQSQKQSKIYQKNYQEALKGQVSGILDKLHADEYDTIDKYLSECYTDAFIGTAYDLAGQGIPVIMPIDQAAAVKAILTDSKVSKGLYNALGVDVNGLKKSISSEITRGIASGLSYSDIARNISNASKAPFSRAKVIARTEGHRIQQASTADAQKASKARGADVVKQWDSTLDGKTRPTHRELDGQIREVDEYFEVAGKKAKYPGDFNDPSEDCNCRCVSLTRARWALGEDELQTLKDRAEYFGIDKTKDFEDFKVKYLKAAESEAQFGVQYGKDAVNVDFDYINSKEYRDKFSNITGSAKANEAVYDATTSILKHCDGTEHEDLYLLGMDGKVLAKVTDSASKLGINYTDEFKDILEDVTANNIPVIAIHNHPHGTPPSPDDFRKAFENKYQIGVAVGHNGQVYVYSNDSVEITLGMADQMSEDIEFLYRMGWDIDRASKMVYDEYGLNYTFQGG